MLKYLLLLILIPSVSFADHWASGCWNCRSWGAINVLEDGYVIYTDPEGNAQDIGVWQNYTQDSIIIMWMESSMMEIIEKREKCFVRQSSFGFGVSSEIEEVKKIRNNND